MKLRVQVGTIHRNPKFQSKWGRMAGAKANPDPGSEQSAAPERKELHDRLGDPLPRHTRRIHLVLGRAPILEKKLGYRVLLWFREQILKLLSCKSSKSQITILLWQKISKQTNK